LELLANETNLYEIQSINQFLANLLESNGYKLSVIKRISKEWGKFWPQNFWRETRENMVLNYVELPV
jgi:hypothetical protein